MRVNSPWTAVRVLAHSVRSSCGTIVAPPARSLPHRLSRTRATAFPTVVDTRIHLPYRHRVPTVCRFYGILIQMYYNDHDPPHFHVVYNEFKAVIAINDLSILFGDLPPKAVGLVMEWARLHKSDLLADWRLSQQKQPLNPISPLE